MSVESAYFRRLEVVDALLPAVAGLTDLREELAHLSVIVRRVLAHDAMSVSLIGADALHVHAFACSGGRRPESLPERLPLRDSRYQDSAFQYSIVDDARVTEPESFEARVGYRSVLRVPIRIRGRAVAMLGLALFEPGQYREADGTVARGIADLLGLALPQALLQAWPQALPQTLVDHAAAPGANGAAADRHVPGPSHMPGPIGSSTAWRAVLALAAQVAPSDTNVLLLGESGTGKEVVARYVHQQSSRRRGPFVAINCAALPEHLVESELFGAERGAFTGATHTKMGRIQAAAGGTLFLDEVAELPLTAQAKLLRAIEQREYERLGSTRVERADVRLVAATNRDLRSQMDRGVFREDLYYRLDVFSIRCPPLRARPDDILPLAEHFVRTLARGTHGRATAIADDARRALLAYDWPGNVRELRNVVERAIVLCADGVIRRDHLGLNGDPPPGSAAPSRATSRPPDPPDHRMPGLHTPDLRTLERAAIERALRDARNNKSAAARTLGLTRRELYGRLRRYGLAS